MLLTIVSVVRAVTVVSLKVMPVFQGNPGGTVIVAQDCSEPGTDNAAGCCRRRPQQVTNLHSSFVIPSMPFVLRLLWKNAANSCLENALVQFCYYGNGISSARMYETLTRYRTIYLVQGKFRLGGLTAARGSAHARNDRDCKSDITYRQGVQNLSMVECREKTPNIKTHISVFS